MESCGNVRTRALLIGEGGGRRIKTAHLYERIYTRHICHPSGARCILNRALEMIYLSATHARRSMYPPPSNGPCFLPFFFNPLESLCVLKGLYEDYISFSLIVSYSSGGSTTCAPTCHASFRRIHPEAIKTFAPGEEVSLINCYLKDKIRS